MHTKFLIALFKGLFILALISFFIGLWIPYIGEEGVYTISSYEMWFHQHFFYPTLYGIPYWRPPLFNWLIIFFSNLIGWGHMLVASRFVTAGATISNSIMLIWLGKRLFKTTHFGLFAALIYLTSDALFYHGWIAYADPLFAFFVASSIALLWVANLEQCTILVWLAALALIAAFMTKALTAYVFYGLSFITIFYRHRKNKDFLLKPINFLPQLIALIFPFFWRNVTHGVTGPGMWMDILHKFSQISTSDYIQQIILFPLIVFIRFLPAAGLVIYIFLSKKYLKITFDVRLLKTLIAIIIINFIPYWLSPHTGLRYVLPLYPFIALLLAAFLWHLPKPQMQTVAFWLVLAILAKYIELIFLFYYQHNFRGDYAQVAKQVVIQSKGLPLYSNDDVATGLSVTAKIDNLIYPKPPVQAAQFAKEKDYFVINSLIDPKLGKLYKRFKLGKQRAALFLLCQGKACEVN